MKPPGTGLPSATASACFRAACADGFCLGGGGVSSPFVASLGPEEGVARAVAGGEGVKRASANQEPLLLRGWMQVDRCSVKATMRMRAHADIYVHKETTKQNRSM